MSTSEHRPGREWPRTALKWGGTTVLAAVVGNAFWDYLAKPGLNSFGRTSLTIVTFGSEKVRNAAYSMAALDPYPLPALLLFIGILMIPILLVLDIRSKNVRRIERRKDRGDLRSMANRARQSREEAEKVKGELEAEMTRLEESIKRSTVIIYVLSAMLFIGLFVTSQIVNQSVLVRRIYSANMAAVAPHISEAGRDLLNSRFAQVRSKGDFRPIAQTIDSIATSHSVRLWDFGLLW